MNHAPGRSWLPRAFQTAALLLVLTLGTMALPSPIGAEERVVQLAVPYRGQLDGSLYAGSNCGPAALAMVLAGFDREVSIGDVRATVNDLQRTWGNPDAGTAIDNLALIGERHGLEPLDLFAGKRLRRWTMDDVRAHLDAGRPIVAQVWYRGLPGREHRSYNGDHYIVLVGYANDAFIYHDPVELDGIGPAARISEAQLEVAWQESDLPFAALAFAGPPERRSLQPPPTPTPTATPPPTATPFPTATATATATATPTPSPTATASPTPAPAPPMIAPISDDGLSIDPSRTVVPAPPVGIDGGPAVPLAMLLLVLHLARMIGRWPPARQATHAAVYRPALRLLGALLSVIATR